MGLRRVSEPTVEPISLAEAKQQINVQHNESDGLIFLYIRAARTAIENWCHIVVAESEWELTYDNFATDVIKIAKSPLLSVLEVVYLDVDGAEQTVNANSYTVDTSQAFGNLVAATGGWPATNGKTNAVRISFTAGWRPADVPAALRQAILLLVAQWFENREPTVAGSVSEIPFAVEALISPYRVPVLV